MSRHANRKSLKPKRPKTKLGLPDLDHSKSAVLDSLRSPESGAGFPAEDFGPGIASGRADRQCEGDASPGGE
jgi:hypothetical protein